MKKGNHVWLIVNQFGNFWNGETFIMYHEKAKKYRCYGKALNALPKAKATIKEKHQQKYVTITKLLLPDTTEFSLNSEDQKEQ